jgi:hypothetical protein
MSGGIIGGGKNLVDVDKIQRLLLFLSIHLK